MSSLLVLQNKDTIIMASDTSASIKKNNKYYRVSNDETKLFQHPKFTIFASGQKIIRDIFISMIDKDDSIESIEHKLKEKILPHCNEFSLGVVISEVFNKYSKVTFLTSYNKFNREESISTSNETNVYTAGIKTKEVSDSFEKLLNQNSLIDSIVLAFKENSCESLGGNLDVVEVSENTRKHKKFKIDNIQENRSYLENPYISLIWGEHIFGKIISGVNLRIEDESGVWLTKGSRTTIYDRNQNEVMRLGLVSDNIKDANGNLIPQQNECFGLVSWNDITKVSVTDCEGISIYRKKDDDWQKVLWANTDGTLYTYDLVAERIKIVNNLGQMILDAENNYFDIGLFDNIVADGKLTTLEKLQIITELYKIHSDYKSLLHHAEKYIRSSRDDKTNTEGAFNTSTQSFPTAYSTTDRYSTSALEFAYSDLITYISDYIRVINTGTAISENLLIDANDPLTESTSEIEDRGLFIQKFKNYYEEATRLREEIEDSIFYSGLQMGQYHNNLIMNEFGFIAVRSDGKYRAYLNATNGLALQKWENNKWVSKLYATLGDPMWEDGTLYAEGLVTKNLRIVDGQMGDAITFDWYDGITIYGQNDEVIKLSANEAISIYVNGKRKFYVGTDGRLYAIDLNAYNVYAEHGEFHDIEVYDLYAERVEAHDITAYGLKIVDGEIGEKIILHNQDGITINGNSGEQIRLNANEGIAIDVNDDKRFWIGTDGLLYAKRIVIVDEFDEAILDQVTGSYIADLTVNRVRTLNSPSPADHVYIADNFIKIMSGNANNSALTKFELTTINNGTDVRSTWGAGDGSGGNQGFIIKDGNRFAIEYKDNNKRLSSITFNASDSEAIKLNTTTKILASGGTGIRLQVNSSNYIEITTSGIKIVGSRIDLN